MLKNINNLLKKVKVLNLTQESADKFGSIKSALQKKGGLIEGLKLENWFEDSQY